MNSIRRAHQLGVSLIELMVALVIGSILILGLVEVFAASRTAYQLSEGLSRVQENGRFAVDYLQRDLRMAGHMGCVNDQARFQSAPAGFGSLFVNAANRAAENYGAAPFTLQFDSAVAAYEANGTGPGSTVNLAAPAAGWSPALPAAISALGPAAGSDVIVLRYFSAEGVPMLSLTPGAAATITVDPARWGVLTSGGVANPGLFGIADCLRATVFQAETTDPATGEITVDGSGPLNLSDFSPDRYLQGQTTVHRAESVAYYIALNTGGNPALFRTRFSSTPGGALATGTEEVVEGIENMQLLYGQDRQTDPNVAPSGYIDSIHAANGLIAVGTPAQTWRRVGLVKVGLLAVSPDRAAAQASAILPQTLGVQYTTPPNDGNFRAVYETTIALRNRLYGN